MALLIFSLEIDIPARTRLVICKMQVQWQESLAYDAFLDVGTPSVREMIR